MDKPLPLDKIKSILLLILLTSVCFLIIRAVVLFNDLGRDLLEIKTKIETTAQNAEVIRDVILDKGKNTREKILLKEKAAAKLKELESLGNELKVIRPQLETLLKNGLFNTGLAFALLFLLSLISIFWKTTKNQNLS